MIRKKARSHFKIKSLNREKIFNKISQQFVIYDVKQRDGFIEFEVDESDGEEVEKFLNQQNVKIYSAVHKGLRRKILNILKMWGVVAGLAIGFVLYSLQYFFVFKIEVWGCDELNESEVANFVKENMTSRFKGNIDTQRLEISIRDNFELVSSVSVAIVGQSLIVNINEAILPEELNGEFEPIVSQYDGLVTEINLVQGTLNVKQGDIVQKGDILVYPYIIDGDGEQRPVQPKAEIFADVWVEKEDVFYEYQIVEERTGQKIECSQVTLFGLVIYSNTNENTFESFESEKTSSYIAENNILPLIYTKYTFYETKTTEIIRNFEQEKDDLFENLRQKTLIYLPENAIIKDEKSSVKEMAGVFYLSYIITTSLDIGEGYGYTVSQN